MQHITLPVFYDDAIWWYGNVYEAGDPSRPLNWWKP